MMRSPPTGHIRPLLMAGSNPSGCKGKGMFRLSAIVSIFVCALTTASFAGPQSYCDPFARDAANQKMGQAETATGTIGGGPPASNSGAAASGAANAGWQKAYEASFATCMSNFTPRADVSADRRESVKPAMVKPAAVKRTTVKRAVFPDGAEVSLPRRTHASRAKKATKLASRAKSAHPHPAEPAAVQDPSIESTSDTAAMKTDISAARHRQPKDQAQDAQAQAPQHCTNLVCWLKQRRTKP